MDDDMLKYYCNEDSFLLSLRHSDDSDNMLDIVLIDNSDH